MNDIYSIDGKKCLNFDIIEKFRTANSNDDNVSIWIGDTSFYKEKKMSEFESFFYDEDIEKAIPSDDTVICFATEKAILVILGLDFNWWIAPYRRKKYGRLPMLFQKQQEKEPKSVKSTKQPKPVYTCEIRKVFEDGSSTSFSFEGYMKDLLVFVNKKRTEDQLRTFFKSDLTYNINNTGWKTYEQLIEEGVFVE